MLELGPGELPLLPVVPVRKQLLLQIQQLRADFTAGTLAVGDGGEVPDQVRPAQLTLLQRQVVVGD